MEEHGGTASPQAHPVLVLELQAATLLPARPRGTGEVGSGARVPVVVEMHAMVALLRPPWAGHFLSGRDGEDVAPPRAGQDGKDAAGLYTGRDGQDAAAPYAGHDGKEWRRPVLDQIGRRWWRPMLARSGQGRR